MKSRRNYLTALASLAFLALAGFSSPAKAQSATYEGRFTLPYEVAWQDAQLPAGDYTFTMNSKAFPARMVVRGPNGAIFVSAMSLSADRSSDNSELYIENRDGKRFVRELYLADYDLHFRYFVPKMKNLHREVLLAQGPSTTGHLAVLKGRK
jgi:hypothetical protein